MAGKEFHYAIVGTAGLPAQYGGFETLAAALVHNHASRYKVLVYCSKVGRTSSFPEKYQAATLRYSNLNANGWQSIPYDFVCILRAAKVSGTVLILGVSGCAILPLARLLFRDVRFVTNIDGIEWKREKWGRLAKLVLRYSEYFAVQYSHEVITDNKGIYDYVLEQYQKATNVVAYGADSIVDENAQFSTDQPCAEAPYYLLLCRIEPENNVHIILEAFDHLSGLRVIAVGNWNHSEYSRQLKRKFANSLNIDFRDPVYVPEELYRLRTGAAGYVHGHSAGGTNPSLVEAMGAGLAVFAYDVSFNRYTTDNEAFYWKNATELADLLVSTDPRKSSDVGKVMSRLARTKYTWPTVAKAYESILFPRSSLD